MIIAVDGTTASGKGTIARGLAAHFHLPYLDTGLLYRAVGAQLLANGGDPDSGADALAACAFADHLLADPELRNETMGNLASRVSVHPAVRAALYARQRGFALQPGGAVLDGRDIGTVICPEADVKLYVDAPIDVRAARRCAELRAQGREIDLPLVVAQLRDRDARDATRAIAPAHAAPDALRLDTAALDIAGAIAAAIATVIVTLEAHHAAP